MAGKLESSIKGDLHFVFKKKALTSYLFLKSNEKLFEICRSIRAIHPSSNFNHTAQAISKTVDDARSFYWKPCLYKL